MKARVAKLESDVGYIKDTLSEVRLDIREIKKDAKSDFRMLFGALITTALGLAALMAKGFHWFYHLAKAGRGYFLLSILSLSSTSLTFSLPLISRCF